MPATQGGLGDPLALIGVMLALTFVLELVRFVWVLAMDAVDFRARKRSSKASDHARFFTRRELRNALAMTFAGPKGGITLSLMLTVPGALALVEGVAVRTTLISIASGVILLTLLLANFAVPLLVPHKHAAKKTKERVDAEARLLEAVIESVQQDAHFTGMVTADAPEDGAEGAAAADEPATVIVMKRYADQLADLLPHASADVAAHGRAVVAACDTLYDSIDQLAEEVAELDDDNAEGEDALAVIDPSKLTAHFRMLRSVYDAVEDVQAQALVRELEIIKRMRAAGELTPDQAKQLRNDVYIQQMTLD